MIKNINYRNVVAKNVTIVGQLAGIKGDPFTGICISNATIEVFKKTNMEIEDFEEMRVDKKKLPWNCTAIRGVSSQVTPKPCDLLPEESVDCSFPDDKLAIETVVLKTCSN